MNSQAVQTDLVLTRRLADGTTELISIGVAHAEPALAGAEYSLIDRRGGFDAPSQLVVQRQGADLILSIDGAQVLSIGGFFATRDVTFYPAPDVIGGAGPFSGEQVTPESAPLARSSAESASDSSGDVQTLWSAEPSSSSVAVSDTATQAIDAERAGGISPLVWVGLGVGALGAAAGGGGGGGGSSAPVAAGSGGTADTDPPQITSGATADALDENSGAGKLVYTALASDANTVTWSLSGADADAFTVDPDTGAVTLAENPDFETQSSYSFAVVATDGAGNSSSQNVVLSIVDQDEEAPVITSGATAGNIDENSGPDQVVYAASADTSVTWMLVQGEDSDQFGIDAQIGAVTLLVDPDFETKSDYSFTVIATDEAGNESGQRVTLGIGNLDEVAPTITSGPTAPAIDENSGAGQNVYTVTSTDEEDISSGSTSYSLGNGDDAEFFDIDPAGGAVTLSVNPDFETQSSYAFTVIATDAAGNSSEQSVTLRINDVGENQPVILSGSTAAEIAENSGSNQVIYNAVADVDVTWQLAPGADALSIDALSGAVTLADNPDFEAQSTYAFTVIARTSSGLESQQAVTLNIGNLDEVAPTITSGPTTAAVDENSGAGQVTYTVTSTDDQDISSGSTSYSLSRGGDEDAFTIDADTGAVRLTANPDFETQPQYDFTVVATDTAGNSSELGVSLAINDIDETVPSVVNVALTEGVGGQGDVYNAGDTVRVTVSMSTEIVVDTAGGIPRVALDIGGDTAFADFVSGGGTSSLVFEYVIQAGENDSNGIRIRANSVEENGGSLTSIAGTPASLVHGNVRNNPEFVVDTEAPNLRSSNPNDNADNVNPVQDIELRFTENIAIGSGNIVISDGADIRTIDVTDVSQVRVEQDRLFINLADDLNPSREYSVQVEAGAITDVAGNPFAGISDPTTLNFGTEAAPVDTSIVVFDLVQGTSSNHSGRSFSDAVSYDIYIRVDSSDSALSTAGDGPGSWGRWDDVDNLGSDDRIILVGNGGPVAGRFANPVEQIRFEAQFIAWESGGGAALDAARIEGRSFVRITGGFFPAVETVQLFDSSLRDDYFAIQNGGLSTRYFTSMPAGVLTSQGLV